MSTVAKQDKDPQDVDDIAWDWKSRLVAGETIAAFAAEVTAGDWTLASTSISGTKTNARVEGGTVGTQCRVRGRITTSSGRQLHWTLAVYIAEQ